MYIYTYIYIRVSMRAESTAMRFTPHIVRNRYALPFTPT